MYSTAKGTAINMNIDDVTRVLEYTGEAGSYYDPNTYEYTPTKNVKTIGQISKNIGYDMSGLDSYTPENEKDISAYKADYFYIDRTSDIKEYNTARTDLIYPATANTKLTTTYWLSSPCVYARFNYDFANFDVRYVYSINVDADYVFDSYGNSDYDEYALRPVVTLTSDIQVTYNGTTAAIN